MESSVLELRARRLGRLRSSPPVAAARPSAGRTSTRPRELARTLGGQVVASARGSVVVVEVGGPLPLQVERLAALPDPIDARHPLICLDTETTGLGTAAGTLAFLVGLGVWDGERFTVRQFVLPDHTDEAALLDEVAAAIPPDGWLVTYNGRAFDWPLLVARFRLHRREAPRHAGHLDLLPIARSVWRHRLMDARLASVEAGVCGVRRMDDLPGALIPERYFHFLRTGQAGLLTDIVRHNRQDIASLARLLRVLAIGLDPQRLGQEMEPADVVGLGRAFLRRRRYVSALACFDAAIARGGLSESHPMSWQAREWALVDRSRVLGRLGRHAEAAFGWRQIAESGGHFAAHGWIHVAKHHEHRTRDLPAAFVAATAAARLSHGLRARGAPLFWLERDLERRLPRVKRKMAGSLKQPAPASRL